MTRGILTLLLTLTLTFSLSACSDGVDGENEISGSAAKTYDLDFDEVRITKQVISGVFQAMNVLYVRTGNIEYIPLKLVVNAPIDAGKKITITESNAALVRVMQKGGEFSKIETGTVEYGSITPGENCKGEFYVTFMAKTEGSTKTTLNGKFEATVQQVPPP
jgi:hypothetical protein